MTTHRLDVRGVRKTYGATSALTGVDLVAEAGEVHAILGENGAGKSTLMKILSGLEAPDAGTIALDGAPYQPRRPAEARDAGVVLVSQELALCSHLTVEENIVLGQEPRRRGLLDRAAARRVAEAALREVGAERIAPESRAGDLPIAEQQLVEIARAVSRSGSGEGKVLILDEPTSSLAQDDAQRLFALVRRLRDGGRTVLYISHFLEEVQRVADRYTVLRDGATTGAGALEGTPLGALVEKMVGRQVQELFVRSARVPGDVILQAEGLGADPKPLDASFELRRGEVLGIAGLVGAGRTELLRAIFGLTPVRKGWVRVRGMVGPGSPAARLAQGVGMLSEDRRGEGLALELSIADNVTLSRMPRIVRRSPQRRDASAQVAALGIKCQGPSQRVGELSGGNQQKVALARLLHHGVDVLLLDEPTRGIDVGSKAHVYALIDRLAADGKAVLMVSSYLPELLGTCDRIAVMCRGRLGAARPAAGWTEHALLEHATGAAA